MRRNTIVVPLQADEGHKVHWVDIATFLSCHLLSRYLVVGVSTYIYAFLGIILVLGGGSILIYCHQQRQAQRFVGHDNANNNMQRHSLLDR